VKQNPQIATGVDTQRIRERIRSLGLRATAGRIAVVERLLEYDRPVTHGELAEALAPQGFDRASLFRNLVDLTESGLVSRTDLGDHVWRYYLGDLERPPDAESHYAEHPHFVCVQCGRTMCLHNVTVVIKASPNAPRSVRSHQAEINLRGLCDNCNPS
jgi:Fur family ferric uptake transcriptional regulator